MPACRLLEARPNHPAREVPVTESGLGGSMPEPTRDTPDAPEVPGLAAEVLPEPPARRAHENPPTRPTGSGVVDPYGRWQSPPSVREQIERSRRP
jgi:hypothetical protein